MVTFSNDVRERVPCAQCSAPFTPRRSTNRFCSSACRQAAYRNRLPDPEPPAPEPGPSSATLPEAPPAEADLTRAVRSELERLAQVDTWEGQMALSAARKIASSTVGSGTTGTLMKELKGLMHEIRQNAKASGTDNGGKAEPEKSEMQRIRERRSYKAESA